MTGLAVFNVLGRTSHFLFLGRTSYILRTFNKSISLLGGTSKKNILYICWILTLELSCYVIEGPVPKRKKVNERTRGSFIYEGFHGRANLVGSVALNRGGVCVCVCVCVCVWPV